MPTRDETLNIADPATVHLAATILFWIGGPRLGVGADETLRSDRAPRFVRSVCGD